MKKRSEFTRHGGRVLFKPSGISDLGRLAREKSMGVPEIRQMACILSCIPRGNPLAECPVDSLRRIRQMNKKEETASRLTLDLSKFPPHLRPPSRPLANRMVGVRSTPSTQRSTEWADYVARFEGNEL